MKEQRGDRRGKHPTRRDKHSETQTAMRGLTVHRREETTQSDPLTAPLQEDDDEREEQNLRGDNE